MKYRGLFLDLDGTILDTIKDIQASVNFSLREHNLKERSLEQIRQSIGRGSKHLIKTSIPLGIHQNEFNHIFDVYKQYYIEHVNDYTTPYDGVKETLSLLKTKGVKIAIITNKPFDLANQLISIHFLGIIDILFGQTENSIPKPDPSDLYKAIENLGLKKEEIIYVGDSLVDYQTALNAKVKPVLCSYGFEKADVFKENTSCDIIKSFSEIRRYF